MLNFILHYYTGLVREYDDDENIIYEGSIRNYVETNNRNEIMDYFTLLRMSANPGIEIIPQASPVSNFGFGYYY